MIWEAERGFLRHDGEEFPELLGDEVQGFRRREGRGPGLAWLTVFESATLAAVSGEVYLGMFSE
jgi:hypothetical protein